jgi:hypothetical protein
MTSYTRLDGDRRGSPLARLFAALACREPSELLLGLIERGFLHPTARARVVLHLERNPPRRADWNADVDSVRHFPFARIINLAAQEELLAPLLG